MRSRANKQIMVGIPRDSDMERFYQDEAKDYGVKLPTFIYQLLKDRYDALHGNGHAVWFPRGYEAQSPKIPAVPAGPTEIKTSSQAAIAAFGEEDED